MEAHSQSTNASIQVDLVAKALQFANKAHSGQKRKFTGADYITHPVKCFALAVTYGLTNDQAVAMLLHDVVEDTSVSINEITAEFGGNITRYVWHLTNEYTKERYPELNYNTRKLKDYERLVKCDDDILVCKIVDRLANIYDCLDHFDENNVESTDFLGMYLDSTDKFLNYILDSRPGLEKENDESKIAIMYRELEVVVRGTCLGLME